MSEMDMVKACEKGCIRASIKLCGIELLIGGVLVGAVAAYNAWENRKTEIEDKSVEEWWNKVKGA